jgi:CRP-like cAMP-binding protein
LRFGPKEKKPILAMLQQTTLFSTLSQSDLERIAKKFVERSFQAGDAIVHEGEEGVGFYLIIEGSAEVRRSGRLLSRLGKGQFFGEMTLLDEQPRSADVVAAEPTKCLVLNTFNFSGLVHAYPGVAIKIMKELTRRLRATSQSLTE